MPFACPADAMHNPLDAGCEPACTFFLFEFYLHLFLPVLYCILLPKCPPDDRGALIETGELQNDDQTRSSLPYPAWKLSSISSTWWPVSHGLAKPTARNWPGEALGNSLP